MRTNMTRFYICVYVQCRRRRPTYPLLLKFPFSQSTDVVVVNFVVVLKFPNMLKSASNKCGFRPTTLKDFKIACSQTLWFLFENRGACVYENVNRAEARFLRLRAHQIVNRL